MKNAKSLTWDENYNIEATGRFHHLRCSFKFLVKAFQ